MARFAFDPAHPRAQLDGARIISRLMRQMDFGAVQEDGSVIVVFAETDLRTAHMIARRLSSVMRHTSHGKRDARAEPVVSVADAAAERFGEVAAGAALRGGAPRRILECFLASRNNGSSPALTIINSALEDEHEENCTDHRIACDPRERRCWRKKPRPPAPRRPKPNSQTVSKDEMFSSKLKGLNVYNQKDESVGEITDIAIKNNQIDALILSVGGFLGMGEHYVAVVAVIGQHPPRRQERQMAGVDEHHQGRAEGRARVQVSEVRRGVLLEQE